MIENTKQNAPIQDKIKYLLFTYIIVISLWFACAHLVTYLTPSLKTNSFLTTLANLDTFKIIIIFFLAYLSDRYIHKLITFSDIPLLILRFIVFTLIICCINIRWSIHPDSSEYYTYIYNIGLLAIAAQLLRIPILIYNEKKNNIFKKYEQKITNTIFILIIGIVCYMVFTITERINDNQTVLAIDKLLVNYLKYPLALAFFAADSAFSRTKPTAKGAFFDLYGFKISEYVKSAGIRLFLFLMIYYFIAGFFLTDALVRNSGFY